MTTGTRLWPRRMARFALLFFSLGLILLVALLLLWPKPRTFAVQAATRGVSVVVNQAAMSKWLFGKAKVCFRNEVRPSAATGSVPYQGPCDPMLYDVVTYDDLEVEWPNGIGLDINKAGPVSPLIIQIDRDKVLPLTVGDRAFGASDLLIVAGTDWLDGGTLTIGGNVIIGRPAGPGESGNLLSGSYRVSERLMLASGPVVLMKGDFFSGDQVQILSREKDMAAPAQVFGFIEPRDKGEAGFGVTFYSAASDSMLSIDRFGAVSIQVAPTWFDRFLVNPTLLGGSALLALISSLACLKNLGTVLAWAWQADRPLARRPDR